MKIGILGGLKRLENDYEKICELKGFTAKVFNEQRPNLRDAVAKSDIIILMTNNVNHNVANMARNISKKQGIPLYQTCRCGVKDIECLLEECISCCTLNNNDICPKAEECKKKKRPN